MLLTFIVRCSGAVTACGAAGSSGDKRRTYLVCHFEREGEDCGGLWVDLRCRAGVGCGWVVVVVGEVESWKSWASDGGVECLGRFRE